MGKINRDQLRGVVQVLHNDPSLYLAFGPFWWELKRLLREYWPEAAANFGKSDEAITRARLRKLYPDEGERFAAALHHFEQKVANGEAYDGASYWPHLDRGYTLHDPDMGFANVHLAQHYG